MDVVEPRRPNLPEADLRETNVPEADVLGAGGHWRNWVGNQSFVARHFGRPGSEDELCAQVREAARRGLGIRVAGSGHSFTPVVATPGLSLSLEGMTGLVSVDAERARVTVRAGTRIGDIGRALKARGLSLANQGDIDSQAIAGALSTGTHGTGITLGNMSSQAVAMRLVQPDGSVLEASMEHTPELMLAARVAVGMLGVISTVTLQALPAYNLHERLWRCTFDECIERHDQLAAENRHFGFFWCPVAASRPLYCLPDTARVSTTARVDDVCEMKVMNVTAEAPREDHGRFEKIAYSSEIYPIEYVPNFHELEYAVPVAHGREALCEVRALMLRKHTDCVYPVEYRFVAGDGAWLSPFHEADSVTISVSGGPGMDYWPYLRDVDMILRRYGARPHWGKLHFNEARDIPRLYPRSEAFRALRARLDPACVFMNEHLRAQGFAD